MENIRGNVQQKIINELFKECFEDKNSNIENCIAKWFVYKFINKAKEVKCEQCIEYIITTYNKCPENLEIILFDLLMAEYVWHMGESMFYCNRNPLTVVKTFGSTIFGDKSLMDNYLRYSAKYFVDVYRKLNSYSFRILRETSKKVMMSPDRVELLLSKYVLKSHVQFENMIAPAGHPFEGMKQTDILETYTQEELQAYYQERYASMFLRGGLKGDYPDIFYRKHDILPVGVESIYNYDN